MEEDVRIPCWTVLKMRWLFLFPSDKTSFFTSPVLSSSIVFIRTFFFSLPLFFCIHSINSHQINSFAKANTASSFHQFVHSPSPFLLFYIFFSWRSAVSHLSLFDWLRPSISMFLSGARKQTTNNMKSVAANTTSLSLYEGSTKVFVPPFLSSKLEERRWIFMLAVPSGSNAVSANGLSLSLSLSTMLFSSSSSFQIISL